MENEDEISYLRKKYLGNFPKTDILASGMSGFETLGNLKNVFDFLRFIRPFAPDRPDGYSFEEGAIVIIEHFRFDASPKNDTGGSYLMKMKHDTLVRNPPLNSSSGKYPNAFSL